MSSVQRAVVAVAGGVLFVVGFVAGFKARQPEQPITYQWRRPLCPTPDPDRVTPSVPAAPVAPCKHPDLLAAWNTGYGVCLQDYKFPESCAPVRWKPGGPAYYVCAVVEP